MEEPPSDPLQALARRLGHPFRDPDLLREAVTHRSYAHEQGLEEHYERLEFLGDAVLGAVTAEWLFRRHPELAEGELSQRQSGLVSAPALARMARRLGLGEALRLGVGEERSGGREKESLLADSFEAVLGALFVDGGMGAARRGLVPLLEAEVAGEGSRLDTAPKTRLQEILQGEGREPPEYLLVAAEGPDHRKRFTVECRVGGRTVSRASGRSKKAAEQLAAARAIEALDEAPDGDSARE